MGRPARLRCLRTAGALAAGTLFLVRAAPAVAQAEAPARECCLPLLFSIGARSLALGDAVAARTSAGSLFVNPALLADVGSDQFLVHNANTSIEKSNTFTLLIRSESVGSIALSYRLVDYGEQEARDPSGNPTGTIAVLAQVLTASYATRVVRGVNAGVNYKLYQFRQDCRGFCGGIEGFSATTHGLDLGVQAKPGPIPGLALGVSLLHLGFPLQVVNREQASPMPVRLRFGAGYDAARHLVADSTIGGWITVDGVVSPRDGRTNVNVGVEAALEETIFFRLGYAGGAGITSGAAAGVGLRYDRFDVSVAKSFVSSPIDETEPFQITFGIRF